MWPTGQCQIFCGESLGKTREYRFRIVWVIYLYSLMLIEKTLCAHVSVQLVRELYPSSDGIYIGFKEANVESIGRY